MTAGEALAAMAALPVADLETILQGQHPLVLAPHPDDESLGCGGLLAAAGRRGAVLVVTDGTGSHPNSVAYPAERLRALREAEAQAAAAALGVAAERLSFLRLRDTAAPMSGPDFEAAVAAIRETAARLGCGVVLAPWRHDPHGDHVAVHLMAQAAAHGGLRHLAYPVWGWTLAAETILEGPAPCGWRLDVAAWLPAKRRAIAAHRSQTSGLIDDDPAGFQLPLSFLSRFEGRYETYLNRP